LFRDFPNNLVGIQGSLILGIEIIKPLEGIHGNDNVTGTRIGLARSVTPLHVVQNTSLLMLLSMSWWWW
jgi:hypothetical protein